MTSVYSRFLRFFVFTFAALAMSAHALDESHQLFSKNGEYYLKADPTWVPISGDIFVIIPVYEDGDIFKLTNTNGNWQLQNITYTQFTAANPTAVADGSVSYSDLNSDGINDLSVNLGAGGNNEYVVLESNSSGGFSVRIEDFAWAEMGGSVGNSSLASDDSVTSNFYGTMPGKPGVSGGQASYSVPIAVPPGRNKVQPNISLNYSSRAGNGIAGVGWNLSATSSITRCPATLAQDGVIGAIKFNKNIDKLCLDGQRLILTSGTFGLANSVYRLEMDNMTQVTLKNAQLDASSNYFSVIYPDGRKATFGGNTQSRVSPNGTSKNLSWLISKSADVSGNNTMTYHYANYGAGEKLIQKITYTGTASAEGTRAVTFTYGNRNKPSYTYLAGTQSQSTKLLTRIDTFVDNTTRVRRYTLVHTDSRYSDRDLLKTIQECTYYNGNKCRNKTSFNWSDRAKTVEFKPLGFGGGMEYPGETEIYKVLPRGDVNGDGVRDWAGIFVNAEEQKTGTTTHILKPCYKNYLMRTPICVDADFNQDGRTDDWKKLNNKLYIKYTDTELQTYSWINTNIALDSRGNAVNYQDGHIKQVADYNGDALPDLLVYTFNNYNPQLRLHLHTGNFNSPYPANGQLMYTYPTNIITGVNPRESTTTWDLQLMGDLDGDGLPDMILADKGIGGNQVPFQQPKPHQIWYNNGGSSSISFSKVNFAYTEAVTNMDVYFTYFIDLNADGLSDWLGWQNYDDGTHYLVGRLNKGNRSFGNEFSVGGAELAKRYAFNFTGQSDSLVAFPKYASAFQVSDIDGDGRVEILTPGTRVIEGCSIVYSHTAPAGQRKCGDNLYTNYRTGPDFNNASMINSAEKDDSIYQWDALYIEQTGLNSFSLRREATEFYGHAYESAMVDAFGTGLPSMVTAHGLRYTDNSFNAPSISSPVNGYYGNYGVYISKNKGAAEGNEKYRPWDMIKSVEDQMGVAARWYFRPLTTGEFSAGNDPYYERDEAYTGQLQAGDHDYMHFASSMYTVAQYEVRNGRNDFNKSLYRYKAAVYHTRGRGFQGFREITVDDVANQSRSHSVFEQKFPYTGMLSQTTQYAKDDSNTYCRVSQTSYLPERNASHQNIHGDSLYSMYNLQTQSKSYPLNTYGGCSNTVLSTQTQNVTGIDAYGNVTHQNSSQVDNIDGYSHTKNASSVSTYNVNTSSWYVNRLDKTVKTLNKTTRSSSDPMASVANGLDAARTITTNYSSYNSHRIPELVTTSSSDSARTLSVASDYNTYGLPTWVEQRGQVLNGTTWSNQNRRTSYTYSDNGTSVSSAGYFAYKQTNAKGHATTSKTDKRTGLVTSVTDTNAVTVSTTYDGFGRALTVTAPGTPKQYTGYQLATGNAPSYAFWQQVTRQVGAPEQIQYFDKLGRVLRSTVEGFDGSNEYVTDKEYNARGLVTFESVPYKDNHSRYGTSYTQYDSLGRLLAKDTDQADVDLSTSYSYSGYTATVDVDGLPDMTRTYNGANQLIYTVDAKGGTTRYAYDNLGNPIVIRDAKNNNIKAKYNGLGHKLYVDDPNMGRSDFVNNAFGEVESETDASNHVITYQYDTLGRVISRLTNHNGLPDSTATFTWDASATGCKKGLLCKETENGMTKEYQYDSLLRLINTKTTLDGNVFNVSQSYDGNYGRPKSLTYPNGLTLGFEYNDRGYLIKEKNAATGYVYRHVTEMDAFGNITESKLTDNKLTGTYYFAAQTGQMRSSHVASNQVLHHLYYDFYDRYGNIQTQSNLRTNLSETFAYDDLQRLTNNQTRENGTLRQSVNYAYDSLGNFTYKSDYSKTQSNAYQYGNAGKTAGGNAGSNAVRSVLKLNNSRVYFSYDNRGNLISGDGITANYTAYIKPITISRGGTTSTFSYGSDRMRYKQVENGKTTYYVDKLYEVEGADWRAYISDVAVIHYKASETRTSIRYTHKDRLGSASTLTDHNGNLTERRSFDPFGKPRGTNGSSLLPARLSSFGTDVEITDRGFTDHEHLDNLELIHMNGRVYDYNLGRFMSVDPFVHEGSQGMNPYSYVLNNPLSGTDPSGYAPELETTEFGENDKLMVMEDGTAYLDQGGDTLIKVDSISMSGSASNGAITITGRFDSSLNIVSVEIGGLPSITDNSQNMQSSDDFGAVRPNENVTNASATRAITSPPGAGVNDTSGQAERNSILAKGLDKLMSEIAGNIEESLNLQLEHLRRPSTASLKKVLEKSGTLVPDVGWDIHHIVAWGSGNISMVAARKILETFKIDINSAENLIALPRNNFWKNIYKVPHITHQQDRIHRGPSMDAVLRRLSFAKTRPQAIKALNSLKKQMKAGKRLDGS